MSKFLNYQIYCIELFHVNVLFLYGGSNVLEPYAIGAYVLCVNVILCFGSSSVSTAYPAGSKFAFVIKINSFSGTG